MTVQDNSDIDDPLAAVDAEDEGVAWFSVDQSTFGDRLAGAREASGMSRSDLARNLGVKVSTLRKWEHDQSAPRANKLQMLSGMLGVSITWLLMAEGEGLVAPVRETPRTAELDPIFAEMRQLQLEIQRLATRFEMLETRLRAALQESA